MIAERPIRSPISEMQLVPDPVRSLLNLVPPSLPKLANVSRVVLAYTPQPTLPLTEGSHNSQCCRNIILSFSLPLCLSPRFVFIQPLCREQEIRVQIAAAAAAAT